MTVAERTSKIKNPIKLCIAAYRQSVKKIYIGGYYTKDIFIDGSILETRFYHDSILTKVSK